MTRPRNAPTQNEIEAALLRFRQRGGLVRKLPDERSPRYNLVGARHGAYEDPRETFQTLRGLVY